MQNEIQLKQEADKIILFCVQANEGIIDMSIPTAMAILLHKKYVNQGFTSDEITKVLYQAKDDYLENQKLGGNE